MADNIVGGLFGVDPEQLMRQRQATDTANAYRFAQLDPMQRANMSIYQGSAGLARGVGGLLGGDPELEKVSAIKQLSSQFDLASPIGMRDFARALQAQYPQEAMMAAKRADEMETSGLGLQKTRADIAIQERKVSQDEKLREELSKLPENATDAQYLQVFRQFGSPDQQAAAIERAAANKARLAAKIGDGEGVSGKPGPVGKAGAYRDVDGNILGTAEMKVIRQEFEGGQKLLDTLNQITVTDVKDAQSLVDWTTKGESKALASKKTLIAQTKIAASQLMEQIGQLPPGSASDADMRAAMKSFPGYSDADALAAWVNETKRKLQFSIQRNKDQFGFKARVEPTAPLDLKKKNSSEKPITGWSIVKPN
jgi:hypothetical protein